MKTVVEKAPDAGFMKNDQVYVGGDSGIGGGGGGDVVVGNASTDYGSLAEFESELARLSAPTEHMSVQSWLDNIPDILEKVDFEGREIGTQTSGAFGDDDPAIDYLLDQLDALQMLYEGVVHAREGDLKRYRSALEYYAAMAEAAGVSSYERVLYILDRHGIEEVKELKKEILEAFNKLVRDKAGQLTMKEIREVWTNTTPQKSDAWTTTIPIYEGANAVGARPGVAPLGRPPMVSTGAGYSVKSRAGRFENPGRRASITSSTSSGNSSGESFDPRKPDTSKAFNRTSKKKKKAWK